jgi:hypothetical protein
MASTVLVREALWRASTMLQDFNPQFHRNSERDMVDCANDAQSAITKFLPSACSRIDSILLKPGTLQSIELILAASCKPGDGSTPTDAILGTLLLDPICNMGVDGTTPGRTVRVIDGKTLNMNNPDWHTASGTVIKSVVYDPATPRYFHVTPGAHASTAVWLRIAYTAQPLKIPNTGVAGAEIYAWAGDSTETLTIADEFLDDIVNYIVARMSMKPVDWADANKGAAFAAMFTGSLNAKVAAITGYNPNLQFLPFAAAPVGAAK